MGRRVQRLAGRLYLKKGGNALCSLLLNTRILTSSIFSAVWTFIRKALGLTEVRRIENPDFTIVYLGDGVTDFQLELTWLKDRKQPYNLGDNEFHTAFSVKDMDAALAKHKEMGCVVYQNPAMGIYFIVDPDGYWLEIIPERG